MATRKDTASTIEDIRADLNNLRKDMARLGQQMAALVAETGDETIGGVTERVRRMRATVDEAVSDASERGREALGDVSDNVTEALETSLRDHPVTTLALAIGLGFLFGSAWRR